MFKWLLAQLQDHSNLEKQKYNEYYLSHQYHFPSYWHKKFQPCYFLNHSKAEGNFRVNWEQFLKKHMSLRLQIILLTVVWEQKNQRINMKYGVQSLHTYQLLQCCVFVFAIQSKSSLNKIINQPSNKKHKMKNLTFSSYRNSDRLRLGQCIS